jgi:putative Holliday junction resolvase
MPRTNNIIALDIGERRIGVARGDMMVRIAVPITTVVVDGTELAQITTIVANEQASTVVVGYPRNQSGEATAQTAYVESVAERLRATVPKLVFQDESLTSVVAEQRLKARGRPYQKADIDAEAAAIILQDYLEQAG